MAKLKNDNLKMIRQIREELSLDLEKMTPKQREEFFKGAEELYEGLKKIEKIRAAIAR